ncbi:AAWKG family protein [Streptomyces sp. NPDC018964]|uniref:AAWKG family protein n=1 Tax=Streptomyces sp. NPDC018964 TaxID=3365058 RepID=UPI0037BDB256
MADNVVFPADSVDDYWHTAVKVLTGYTMPARETLFGRLLGNDGIPMMRVEFSDYEGYPPDAIVDAVDQLEWRQQNSGWRVENTDFVVPFYSGKKGAIGDAGVNTQVKMKKARVTLLGTTGLDVPAGGVVMGSEFRSGLGRDFQGQSKDTVWSNKALAQYSYGGGEALNHLLVNGNTRGFSWNDLPVPDADVVDLRSFDMNAEAFDRVAQFFRQRARDLQDWEFDLGKQDASWKGQAAGVFKDIVHALARNYAAYSEQFPASGSAGSAYGDDLRAFRREVQGAAQRLWSSWNTWQLYMGNPLRWLHDVLLEVTDEVWYHNITKVRYRAAINPRGVSGGYHYVKSPGFYGGARAFGPLEQKDTWKKIGEEAIRRWQKSVKDVLSTAGRQALIDIENAFNDERFPKKVQTETVDLTQKFNTDQAAREKADAKKEKEEAERRAEEKQKQAEERANKKQEEAERKQEAKEKEQEEKQEAKEREVEQKQAAAEQKQEAKEKEQEEKQAQKEREVEQKQAEAERKQEAKEKEQEEKQEAKEREAEEKQAAAEQKQEAKEKEQEEKQAQKEREAEQKRDELEAKQEQKEAQAAQQQALLTQQAAADRAQQKKEQERKEQENERKQAEAEERAERKQAEQEEKQEAKEREAEEKQAEAERKQEAKEKEQEEKQEAREREAEEKQAAAEQKQEAKEKEQEEKQEAREREAEEKQERLQAEQEQRQREQEQRQIRTESEYQARQEEQQQAAQERQERLQAEQDRRQREAESRAEQQQREAQERYDRQADRIGAGAGLPSGPMPGPDGATTTLNPDGSVTLDYPDGTSRSIDLPSGEVVTTRPDGSTSTEILKPGESITNSDGSTTTLGPDGRLTTSLPDGSTSVFDPDLGTVTTQRPDGTTVSTPIDPGETLPTGPGTAPGAGAGGAGSSLYSPSYGDLGYEEELYDDLLDSADASEHGMGAGSGAGGGMPMLPMGTRINGATSGGPGSEGERVRAVADDGQPVTTRRSVGRGGQQDETVTAASRNNVATMGGAPFAPPMGGAGGPGQQQTESGDRQRASWADVDEDVWGTDEDGAPAAAIGR